MNEVEYRQIESLTDLTALLSLYKGVFELADFTLPTQEHIQALLDDKKLLFLPLTMKIK